MHCIKCGKELPDDARFCSSCGSAVPPPKPVCPVCGRELDGQAAFCCYCGAQVASTPVSPPQTGEPAPGPVSGQTAGPVEEAPNASPDAASRQVPPQPEADQSTRAGTPAYTDTQPNPAGVSPNPADVSPNPAGVSPNPAGVSPNPAGVSPNPAGVSPNPAGVSPNPAGVSPNPAGVSPNPAGGSPNPAGISPNPAEPEDGVCPHCGSRNCEIQLVQNVSQSGSNYSAGKGCLGLLLAGPFGLLCGLCGAGKKTNITSKSMWVCKNCGNQFQTKADAFADEISQKVSELAALLAMGLTFLVFGAMTGGLEDGTSTGTNLIAAGVITFLGGLVMAAFGLKGANFNQLTEEGRGRVTSAGWAGAGGGVLIGIIFGVIITMIFNRFHY